MAECVGMPRNKNVRREGNEATMGEKSGHFDHPVYKQLSVKNGEINRMTKDELKAKLQKMHLDTRGVKEVLKKRLKSVYKRRKLAAAHLAARSGPKYDYYMVIDFEATCQEHNPEHYRHEIIEFPIVLVDAHKKEVVKEFHSYVKPNLCSKLTPFCSELTGITQETVDKSPIFSEVLDRVESWMKSCGLDKKGSCAVVTDGPWDMSRFLFIQCQLSVIPFPKWARKWVNLRKLYCNYYQFRKAKLATMLEYLGMSFEGQQHSGIDDARNIARIVIRMLEDGCDVKVNERLFEEKLQLVQEAIQSAKSKENVLEADVIPIKSDARNSDSDSEGQGTDDEDNQDHGCHASSGRLSSANDLENNLKDLQIRTDEQQSTGTNSQVSESEESEDQEQDIDDLLSYYALQKS